MAKITISTFTPERRELRSADPSGETWVKIKPPGMEEEIQRGRLTSKRTYRYDDEGFMEVAIDTNTRLLWAEEMWLTYKDTNLHVVLEGAGDDDEDVEITFKPRSKTDYQEFMKALLQLPRQIFYEWHHLVTDVVPEWRRPF